MVIPCDVSSECGGGGGLVCIEHRCVLLEDAQREREVRRDPVRKRYAGASAAAFAGFAFEGRSVDALGGDLFAGVRLQRWFSLEGAYAYDFELVRPPVPDFGPLCAGGSALVSESFHWQTVGVRAWFHPVHLTPLDLSVAPVVNAGFTVDRSSTSCTSKHLVEKDPVLELGTAFAVEVRPLTWLGVRLSTEVLVAFGVQAVAIRAALGPVIRF